MIKYLIIGGVSVIVKEVADHIMEDSFGKNMIDGGCIAISMYCVVKPIIDVLLELDSLTK